MLANERCQLTADAFKCIFNTYRNQVYGYVYGITHSSYASEEITQEIFIKLWIRRDSIAEIRNLDHYLFTMARNKTLNYLRKLAYEKHLMDEIRRTRSTEENNVAEHSLRKDYNNQLQEALGRLSPQRRLVYLLSRNKGMGTEEIAVSLNLSQNTVKNHLVTALKAIRAHLQKYVISLLSFLMLFNS